MSAPGPMSRAANSALQKPGSTGGSDISVATDLLVYRYPKSTQNSDPKTQVTPLVFGRDLPAPAVSHQQRGRLAEHDCQPQLFRDRDRPRFPCGSRRHLDRGTLPAFQASRTAPALELARPHPSIPAIAKDSRRRVPENAVRSRPRATAGERCDPRGSSRINRCCSSRRAIPRGFATDLPAWFDLIVRPPSLDLATWDRFVNGFGNSLAASRETVIDSYLTKFRTAATDVTLDDPATCLRSGLRLPALRGTAGRERCHSPERLSSVPGALRRADSGSAIMAPGFILRRLPILTRQSRPGRPCDKQLSDTTCRGN